MIKKVCEICGAKITLRHISQKGYICDKCLNKALKEQSI